MGLDQSVNAPLSEWGISILQQQRVEKWGMMVWTVKLFCEGCWFEGGGQVSGGVGDLSGSLMFDFATGTK